MKYITKVAAIAGMILAVTATAAQNDKTSLSGKVRVAGENYWCVTEVSISPTVKSALESNDFLSLHRMVEQANKPDCQYVDGSPRLRHVWIGVNSYFNDIKDWTKGSQTVDAAKKAYPNTALSALIESIYWTNYAWNARGNGYASSVSKDSWKLFAERLAKAEKALADGKAYASSNPGWYEEMIIIKSAMNAPQRERDAIFVEGISRFGWYFPIYYARLDYLAPWWGGDWESVDNMIQWSVNRAQPGQGNMLYARMYESIGGYSAHVKNLFKDTKATWPKMKAGFEDLMRHYPNSKSIPNYYARFACDANDRKTYLKVRRSIADKNVLQAPNWGAKRPEVCDAKFDFNN